MIDPMNHAALADAVIAFLAQHTPWLADKLAGAALAQPVREAWELVKRKLSSTAKGKQAVDRLAEGEAPHSEEFRSALLPAIESDPDFAARLRQLVVEGSGNQIAIGDNIKQGNISGSPGAEIVF